VLVTHQVHLLSECDWIVVLADGLISAQGTPEELEARGINFNEAVLGEDSASTDNGDDKSDNDKTTRSRTMSSERAVPKEDPIETKGKLMTLEEKSGGQVTSEMYLWYFHQGGIGFLIIGILISLAGAGSYSYSSFYLSHWGQVAYENAVTGHPLSSQENLAYVNRFGLYSSMAIISTMIRTFLFVLIGLKASRSLHHFLLSGVLRSTTSHFDTTPVGRILNRFSSDLIVTDESLATNMSFVLAMVSSILGIVGSISYTTKGSILIIFCPLLIFYYFIQLYYRRTNTELKRLENITRSPIYIEFNQALVGVKSLRSYRMEDLFIGRIEESVDVNSSVWRLQQILRWWLAIRLETMGGMISCFIAALAAGKTNLIADEYVSLSLQSAFSLVISMKFLMTMGPEVEAMMNSVERIRHYSETIASEEDHEVTSRYLDTACIPEDWPNKGVITFDNVSMSYHGGPLVLKGVSFEIQSKEKIGIAGRTGCGKSSLMVALYRFEPLQAGHILIDGIDISTVPLATLRSRIGIIPQDPVIFSMSVRFNLDPFDRFTDEEIWSSLELVCMKENILSLPNGLKELVAEGGENLSVGQRQLICIARLLLHQPRILVMDESTSSIDNETDTIIQKMIREKFVECTVLTIAHRLHTVIDSDRILVMENGFVQQFATPTELTTATQSEGLFYQLWKKHVSSRSGKRMEMN
jgi:ATP-binding cassette, subfamily C (CFTR/MRP), member 1